MKLIVCGDLSVTEESCIHFNNGDEAAAFGDLCEVFKKADRTIVNLECALTESDTEIRKIGPCLKGPCNTAFTMKKAGITDCALSNNHIFDYGISGLRDTIKALDDCAIKWTGIGDNYEDSRKNHIIDVDGIKIALINVCEHEYSYATHNRIGARPFDEFETMHDIREAKKDTDHVIVIYHGGKEHCRYPSPRLIKACREMVRCGADAVLCQHSHCIGVYEHFEGGHILYGQGNFHFPRSAYNEMWNEGLVVSLDITKEEIKLDLIPIIAENGGIHTAGLERSKQITEDMHLRNMTLHNGEWKKHWHEYCESVHKLYKNAFCGYGYDDDADKTQLFAHFLDCEAHTDVWKELFPTWNLANEQNN